jgi:hypothetical protein
VDATTRTVGGRPPRQRAAAGRTTRRRIVVWVAGLLVAADGTAHADHCPSAATTYVLSEPSRQREVVHRAIDVATNAMSAPLRHIAVRVLRRWLAPSPHIDFAWRGGDLAIALAPHPPRVAPFDGVARPFESANGPATLRRHRVGRSIVETLEQGRVVRRVEYRFDPSCERLEVDWQVAERRYLPRPVRYTLEYRAGAGG